MGGTSLVDFCRMKQLGILLLPPGWDANPPQGYPSIFSFIPNNLYICIEKENLEESFLSYKTTSTT